MNAIQELRRLGESVVMPLAFRAAYLAVLENPRFAEGVASVGHHPAAHQVPGGLALHTLEVARYALAAAGENKGLRALAFVAAVFHDVAKVLDYEDTPNGYRKTEFARTVGHVVGSWSLFVSTAAQTGIREPDADAIGHAILAHHGRKEWGSPVTPQTRLARIIHEADMRSARGTARGK